jgi:predicted transcriptional regulator
MVRVVKVEVDPDAHRWLSALISLSRAERRSTLGEFCQRCGVSYRHLYQVLDGRSALSEEVLQALKTEARRLGIVDTIKSKILAQSLGINH